MQFIIKHLRHTTLGTRFTLCYRDSKGTELHRVCVATYPSITSNMGLLIRYALKELDLDIK